MRDFVVELEADGWTRAAHPALKPLNTIKQRV
jgi:hypothetical protein